MTWPDRAESVIGRHRSARFWAWTVASAKDGTSWLAFLRGLLASGLTGVQLVTSDAHAGLVEAIGAALPGASWQAAAPITYTNLLAKVPKSAQA